MLYSFYMIILYSVYSFDHSFLYILVNIYVLLTYYLPGAVVISDCHDIQNPLRALINITVRLEVTIAIKTTEENAYKQG